MPAPDRIRFKVPEEATGMKKFLVGIMVFALALSSFGCAGMSNTKKGTGIGAASGAVIGGIIGNQAGNTAVGAIIGAAVGGATGAAIGNYMDKQAEEMERDLEGVQVERVGEGIKLTFDSGILFAVNKSELNAASKANLTDLALILNKYDDTNILIEGHTDADGSEAYNQTLSEQRANAVRAYLVSQNVTPARQTTVGYGEMQPIADNTTSAGKAQNRRVEVAIMANDDLKEAMEKKAASGG
jgi:outer membrane protein OmpA-like peptidoglycan-associated protein